MRRVSCTNYANYTTISIHAPRERCDIIRAGSNGCICISIHAPRERCDSYVLAHIDDQTISIHAPRERCDECSEMKHIRECLFQSTHRVSDATMTVQELYKLTKFQSTHRVSDATPVPFEIRPILTDISIHAPRERCDS